MTNILSLRGTPQLRKWKRRFFVRAIVLFSLMLVYMLNNLIFSSSSWSIVQGAVLTCALVAFIRLFISWWMFNKYL